MKYLIFIVIAVCFGRYCANAQPQSETEPLKITAWEVAEKQIHIGFSKPISEFSEPFAQFFSIDERMNLVDVLHTSEPPTVTLLLSDEIRCGLIHILLIKGFEDAQGNAMRDTTLYISTLCIAEPSDIIINEIMADPSPSVRLPEHEYVELYNRSEKNIQIGGWTFSYKSATAANPTNVIMPPYLFPSGGYLLLVHQNAASDLSAYGATLSVLHSTTAIVNSGLFMKLIDNTGTVISWVDFNDDWYGDPSKSNGGWSLEQINPDLICSVESNWKASTGRNGGTPGQQNSVHAPVSMIQAPEIIRIATPDVHTILLYVSNPLGNILPDVSQFQIKTKVDRVEIVENNFSQLQLSLQSPLREGECYDLSITGNLLDCAGYKTPPTNFHFALPQDVDDNDVIINEIMFNPAPNGYSFVELYNRSKKAIKLSDLRLALRNSNGELPNNLQELTNEPFLLLPGQYLVVSRNAEAVKQQYMATNPSAFLQMRNMPALTRTSGRLVLLDRSRHVIDEVHYDNSQHADLLNINSGVSLERINPNLAGLVPANWQSASQTAGFATPGKQNSQYLELVGATNAEVSVHPEVFSPDNDGIDDVLSINYRFDTPSLIGEVIIFDSSGRVKKNLVNRQILSTEGVFFWDGLDNNGRSSLTGIYIVFFRAYNSAGLEKIYKIPCVLAKKMK